MGAFHTIDEIIEKAIALIDQHPLIRDPIVFNSVGSPVRINKYRDHDGFDNNPTGITLSIYPYKYGSSDLTTTSSNAALVYKPYQAGDKYRGGREQAELNLTVKLSTTGFQLAETPISGTRPVMVVRNEYERNLRRWIEILRAILLSNPLVDLGGYVKNSRVHYGRFETTEWTGEGGKNAVLHSATLAWQMDFFPIRDLSALPKGLGQQRTWEFIGLRSSDRMNVYWDKERKDIFTLSGYPIRVTPSNVKVTWDEANQRFAKPGTDPLVALTSSEMNDPSAPAGKPWIDTNLRIVGILKTPATETDPATQESLYVNKTTHALQKADGNAVTQLADGSAITYDPATQRLVLTPVNEGSYDLLVDFTDPADLFLTVRDSVGKRYSEHVSFDVDPPSGG